jgi:hypothetical protein
MIVLFTAKLAIIQKAAKKPQGNPQNYAAR